MDEKLNRKDEEIRELKGKVKMLQDSASRM
jgi:hypothetical protein